MTMARRQPPRVVQLVDEASDAYLLETLLRHTPDSIYFKDRESRFLKLSTALARRMGLSDPSDAVGKTDLDFFAQESAEEYRANEREVMETGVPLIDVEQDEIFEDGHVNWVSTTKMPLIGPDGSLMGIFGLNRDITGRKQAELEIKENQARMASIIATQGDVAMAELDLEEIMRLVVERTQELTKADGAALLILEDSFLAFRAVSGVSEAHTRVRLPVDSTVMSEWLGAGDSVYLEDVAADERLSRKLDQRIFVESGVRSLVAVPLRHDQRTVGLLQVVSSRPSAFLARDFDSLQLLGVVLSAAMSHASEFAAKREQVDALAQFRAMYDGAPIGILFVAPDASIVESNAAVAEILGYSGEEIEGEWAHGLVMEQDRAGVTDQFTRLIAGESENERIEARYLHRNGDVVWANLATSLVRSSDGDPLFAIQMIENISDRKHAEDELRKHAELSAHQALHDALTGLPNRVLFQDRIHQALLTAEREGGRLAVMLLDLDRFKEINDTLGHAAGDHVLKEVSSRLHKCLRASDTVARLGGDEFGLLLPKQNEQSDVVHLLGKLTTAIEEPIDLDGLPLGIEGSIGVAFYPDHGVSTEELIQRADVAMYVAKQDNRSHAFYEETTDAHDPIRLTLVGELRKAIEERQLVVHFQPKASLVDGTVASAEALVRWVHPVRGLIPPDEFIPQAQETALMKPLTLYVLDEALRNVCAWRDAGLDLAVSVNLATRNLIDVAFPDEVGVALEKWGLDARHLELEITESTVLQDPFRTKLVLDRLHAMGIRLSIDDFGTGYSSLAYLRQLPVSEIKIDRSFVLNMESSEDDAVIVRSTVDLGRNLGLEVVAEGVETAETWARLLELGCELAQGYFLAKPMAGDAFAEWLVEHAKKAPVP